ncbi:peptidoglycan recognition protein [Kitasatospora sp. NPDC059146]|uniref:peptidoglycan recognition protein family protein n=1 Tax=Kitasatospora sp. NPDC059146 TaxID=3346741 RepID=UPI003676D7F3
MRFRHATVAALGAFTLLLAVPSSASADGPVPRTPCTSPAGGSVTSLHISSTGTLAPRATCTFELLGVSWDGPQNALTAGSVRVRTRDAATHRWSEWHALESESEDGPEVPTHSATPPLWVGPSDGVAVDVRPGPGGLPRGLRVNLVDPGQPALSDAARRVPERPAGPSVGTAARPEIVTRAGWGADESLREPEVGYTGSVRVVFVHHTETGNDYACSDAPALIRAVYQYHVRTNGWRDIGYNFLVDKCGTIYEGRAGGVDQPVLGAHTLGFNTDSSGVAALGNYSSDNPPQPVVDSLAKIAAWKLGLTGQPADGHSELVSASDSSRYKKGTVHSFNTIVGHLDAFNTGCPGEYLYARLPSIRSAAARLQGT